jgi:cobyrinic acid a,c-diamide synthase
MSQPKHIAKCGGLLSLSKNLVTDVAKNVPLVTIYNKFLEFLDHIYHRLINFKQIRNIHALKIVEMNH